MKDKKNGDEFRDLILIWHKTEAKLGFIGGNLGDFNIFGT